MNCKIDHNSKWDKAGIVLSAICLVHCMVLPFIFVSAQTVESFYLESRRAPDNSFHSIMAASLCVIGAIAFLNGFVKHRDILPLFLGFVGTGLLIYGAQSPIHFHHGLVFSEHFPTIFGSVILILAHFMNQKCKGSTSYEA